MRLSIEPKENKGQVLYFKGHLIAKLKIEDYFQYLKDFINQSAQIHSNYLSSFFVHRIFITGRV